jgi:hypothetical protein
MATLRDEEEQKGSGLNQALGQQPQAQQAQPQEQQAPMEGAGQAQIGASRGAKAPQAPAQKQQKAGTGTFANLKSYLQAAQGGGRVSQAATQRVQNVAGQAQQGIGKAQEAFRTRMQTGSGAAFRGTEPDKYLTEAQAAEQARARTESVLGTARGTTYQAPQPVPVPVEDTLPKRGINPPIRPDFDVDRFGQGINPPIYDRITPPDYDFWKDKTRNPDGTITYKDGTPLESTTVDKVIPVAGPVAGMTPEEIASNLGITQPTKPQVPAQPQQYFTPEDQQRFADIINAQYQGPESLQQAGLYEQAARKAQTAQQALQQAQTAGGREQLLRDIFGRSRDYSRGQSKLDALLLNTSQQGVQSLQEQAQKAGNVQQQLQEAQNLSANEAARRAEAIQGIASGARTAFTEARTAEETATNDRIKAIQDNWNKLPEYFKEALKSGKQLSQQEADLLGITAGTGLYNLTPEDIVKTNAAEANRLISKNELSRQLALQQLAASDKSKQLQKDLLYTDLEKAGTQTASDAINKQAIKDLLAKEEETFREKASQQDITGYGMKKHRQTGKKYYAEETANLKNLLEKVGYSFDKPIEATGTTIADEDDLGLVGEAIRPYGSGVSTAGQAGTALADITTGGVTAGLRGLGLDVTGAISQVLGDTVSSKYAKNTASRLAGEDLQRSVEKALQESGFYNRTAVGETEETKARQAALADILALQEKYRG